MIMKSQKGFTLVELLAVIVVLAILMLVAGTSVFGALDTARKRQYRNEFLGLLEAARIKANLDMMDNKLTVRHGCECYTIQQLVDGGHFQNPSGYTGIVVFKLNASRELTITGWMASDTFMVLEQTDKVQEENIQGYGDSFTTAATCTSKCPGS